MSGQKENGLRLEWVATVKIRFNQVFMGKNVCWLYVIVMPRTRFRVNRHYSSLNVKELLARSRREIWRLSDCNSTRTHNHVVHKRTLNHLGLWTQPFRLWTKWLWVRVQLQPRKNVRDWWKQVTSVAFVFVIYQSDSSKVHDLSCIWLHDWT